jgi:hypothetical protein
MLKTPLFSFTKREDIERVTAAVAAHAPFALPLYRAARDGLLNLIQPERGAQVPLKMLERPGRPIVVLIGDDDHQSTGPEAWACALRVRRWARAGMIHAAGGEAQHYENALAGALLTGRFLLVETSMVHHAGWKGFLDPRIPTLNIISRTGVHPTPTAREAMN